MRHATLSIISLMSLFFTTQALAQDNVSAAPASWAFPLVVLAVLVSATLLFACLFALRHEQERRRQAYRLLGITQPLLTACPDSYILVNNANQIRLSDRAREKLAFPSLPQRFQQLGNSDVSGLTKASFENLSNHLNDVRKSGEVATITIEAQNNHARYLAYLTPLEGTTSHEALVAIWLRNASDIEQDLLEAKEREQQLLRKLLRADALFRASPYPIWRRDTDLKISHVNQAYADAVEAETPQDAIQNSAELVGAPLAQSDYKAAQTALHEQEPQFHTEHVIMSGQRRTLQIINAPLENAQGVGGYALDITDEENIRSELDRFTRAQAEILNMLSTPVAIFGSEKQLIYHNRAFAEVFHLTPSFLADGPMHGEILEKMRERRRVPEQADFPAWKSGILSQYTSLIEPRIDLWHLPDESALKVVTQPHPFGGLLILYEDVTERLALQRSYDTLIKVQRATLDNLREGVAVFGSDGQLKLSNDVFGALWALSDDQLDAAHISDIVTFCAPLVDEQESAEVLRETVLAATAGRETVSGRLFRNDERVVDYAAVPLPDGAALVTFIDVSDSVHIETALRDRNEALETADRLKTEFVANMSYELRTPLTSIIGFAEMLDNEYFGPLNEKQSEYIHNILTSSDRLMVLINDILDLAMTEAGAMALELNEVDLPDLVSGSLAMNQEAARNKGVILSADVDEQCGVIKGDERRLKQVLYNLVSNAIRFTPKDGLIKVSVFKEDGHTVMQVKDTGIGIHADEQDQVFERFRKGSNAGQYKSAGLGLSLVRSFVELHGGEVLLESTVDQGTTVTCLIPNNVPIPQTTDA